MGGGGGWRGRKEGGHKRGEGARGGAVGVDGGGGGWRGRMGECVCVFIKLVEAATDSFQILQSDSWPGVPTICA